MVLLRYIAAHFSPWLNSPFHFHHRDGEALSIKEIGDYGERVAQDFLKRQKIKILYNNYRAPKGGEADIVAREKEELLFIEVKSRRADALIRAAAAVDQQKQAYITKAANSWLSLLGTRNIPWRFDIIEVYLTENEKPQVNWIKNAF